MISHQRPFLQTRKPDPVLAYHLSMQPTHQERASNS